MRQNRQFRFIQGRKIKVIGKRAFASAELLAKHNGEEFVLKEMLCEHVDEKGKKILKKVNILIIAYQYINFLHPTGASCLQSWRDVIMIVIPKLREYFTIFNVICDYTLNKINFTKTSSTY